jgi:hypothetical protein
MHGCDGHADKIFTALPLMRLIAFFGIGLPRQQPSASHKNKNKTYIYIYIHAYQHERNNLMTPCQGGLLKLTYLSFLEDSVWQTGLFQAT